MLNTIYIIQLDNYYDRTVHPYYSEFDNGGLGLYLEFDTYRITNFNFVPNDGINTTVLLNLDTWQFGNYFLVVDQDNKIVSRWFIIDTVRTRGGQYQLTLRRDVITDYWNIIKQSPALIEKCNLDYDNPLIFNNEDMTVNQIKTRETLLKDKTDCPWIVAYIAKDAGAIRGTAKVGSDLSSGAIELNATAAQWETAHKKYFGDIKKIKYQIYTPGVVFEVDANDGSAKASEDTWGRGQKENFEKTSLDVAVHITGWKAVYKGLKNGFNKVGKDTLLNSAYNYITDKKSDASIEEFLELNGKLVYDTNGQYYVVSVEELKTEEITYAVPAGSLYNELTTVIANADTKALGVPNVVWNDKPNEYSYRVSSTFNTYKATLVPYPSATIRYELSDTRVATEDAPYDIIAAPYGLIKAEYKLENGIEQYIETDGEINLAVMQAIAKDLDAACYDIQLVPYCPLPDYILKTQVVSTIGATGLMSFITKDVENENPIKVGIIYNVPKANFNFNLMKYIDCAEDAIQRKINNDCDKWRLCSPNYSNYFDFSVEKNNGVQYFNVDCTYKPYSPYIHINPNFNGLYGQDFNDPRGLVCGGDYSLSQVRSAWESYQLQNKNFQETFDRQIQNMEFNNKYSRIKDAVGASVGTLSGGLAGATTGMVATGGNPIGAAVGSVGGVAASAIGGFADLAINEKLRNETLDYTKDLFGYQLGNVQAIPLTLSKVSAFNQNNKFFPVLEYYTCTDTEKEAYANKIAYNGMTTMVIGNIKDYINFSWDYTINNKTIKSQNYIKARIIRTSLDNESLQIAKAIADEVYKGFYIVDEE